MSETNLSVPASIDIDFDNKKISRLDVLNSILTSKEQLGYKWEFIVQNTLLNLGIHNFEGNPLNPILWKIQGCGYSRYKDNKVDIKTYYFDIECKYVNHRVYPSHVKHNLIPRFTENGKIHVTITNNVKLWSKDARDEARKQNIKIWSLKDLISFYKTPSFISIYNFIRRNVSCTTLLNGYDLKCISDLKCVSKNNVNSKDGIENDGARTEEKTNGSTFKEISPISVKIKTFYKRLKTLMLNLLSNLWNNRYRSITLTNWIPIKAKIKLKAKNKRKLFPCPFRIVVICPYHSQFYTCFLLIFFDYVKRLLKYRCYDEDEIYSRAKSYLLHGMWMYKKQILVKCKCKPKSIIDDEIVDRQFRSPISSFEPCKNYRCSTMISKRICPYLIAIEKISIKPKQLNLSVFMNGDECNEEEARS